MLTRDSVLIGSAWQAPARGEFRDVSSPIDGEVFARVPVTMTADVDAAVMAARVAFDDGPWRHLGLAERVDYVRRLGEYLAARTDELVATQVREVGSPCTFVRRMMERIPRDISRHVDDAGEVPLVEVREGRDGRIVVRRHPIGVVGAIIPWNAPVLFTMTKLLPALLSGCTIVIKPAEESPVSVDLVADAIVAVGVPEGVVSIVPGGREVGEHLVTHPGVDRITFTGSTAAGQRVGRLCGEQMKRVTLELGGKSAAIVLPDVDLAETIPTLIRSALPNNGQACYATTRVLVSRQRASDTVDALVAALASMKVGDPRDGDTAFGPLVSERQRQRVEDYIASGRAEGARVVLGGGRPEGLDHGWYIEPTVFVDVDNSMRIAREEIFGPVLVVIEYDGLDDAVAIANDSPYGLGGAVFASNPHQAMSVAARLRTGSCQINASSPGGGGGPFGGFKMSGIGREKGREGLESYFELQSIAAPESYFGDISAEPASAIAEVGV